MNNKGMVLKDVLIVFGFLLTLLTSLIQFYTYSSHSMKNSIIIEQQKAIELIVSNYFQTHYTKNELINIELDHFTITYNSKVEKDRTVLNVSVCNTSCYEIEGKYDHDLKSITQWQYKNN